MIAELAKILGSEQTARLRVYLGWSLASAVLQGIATLFLVPVLGALFSGQPERAAEWLAGLGALVLVCGIARYQQMMRGFALALIVLTTLHQRLGDHLTALPLGWFSSERIGRLSRSATGGTVMVTNVFAHLLTPVIEGVVIPATIAAGMLLLDYRLALATLACAPLIYLAHRWSVEWIGRTERAVDAAKVLASNRVGEFARHQEVLRAFGRARDHYPPLEAALERHRAASGSMLRHTFPRLVAGGLSVQLAFAALMVVGLSLARGGALEPVELVALLAVLARFVGPLAEVAARGGLLRMASNDLSRLAALFDEKPMPEPEASALTPEPGAIELSNVTFGYVPGLPVLRDVSFCVPSRTMTAIVGGSGSGKTTITRLISRFFDVSSGSVRVGGTDVRELSTGALMAQLSVVMQDVYLFDDTLEANIRVGRADATEAEVREAASLAGVDEIVERLPQGWQTPVGEGGMLLSGGERQRVSIARAVLKAAPIVLLDEATAALDANNERVIQRALRALRERSTLVVIAHRLSTVVAADQILVLQAGRIAESGTHEQLLARRGLYTEFWNERRRARGWRLVTESAG